MNGILKNGDGRDACPRPSVALRLAAWLVLALLVTSWESFASTNLGHPRLYFSTNDLSVLRAARFSGTRVLIWGNLAQSADWCLTRKPRGKWIAPVSPDPNYENLYDRFYAIMGDLAITEHLSFAYALSGEARYGEAARLWVLSSCRTWQREADDKPDSGKAYAVSRLLKGVAVGYDAAFDRFTEAERMEIRDTLARIGQKYFVDWFNTPTVTGPGYHSHHAIVEWGSFGVLALALLGDVPEAQEWLNVTTRKFEEHLLPNGLAPDGAQTEGATFWASTMHYRLFFMDALRRVTRKDLFQPFAKQMNADIALASVACWKRPGLDRDQANVVLEPSYGQLDYYAPILLALAREYRRPTYQHLARWDESLGNLQRSRYVTPHGEELLFELGGYAFLWCDDSVADRADEKRLSWSFPSVSEVYARASWKSGDVLVGLRKGELVVHVGGHAVLAGAWAEQGSTNFVCRVLSDDGRKVTLESRAQNGRSLVVRLDRPKQQLLIHRNSDGEWHWWCHETPARKGNMLSWNSGVALRFKAGRISKFEPAGYAPKLSVAFGKLDMVDPLARAYPLVEVLAPAKGETIIEVNYKPRPGRTE
ncbi:MAG: DUF4962 domain-containing protein [Verrucomicrobia bacterium]|nr:DUF4962 domain-containing protein [Verrucomicrobiota bacterium]